MTVVGCARREILCLSQNLRLLSVDVLVEEPHWSIRVLGRQLVAIQRISILSTIRASKPSLISFGVLDSRGKTWLTSLVVRELRFENGNIETVDLFQRVGFREVPSEKVESSSGEHRCTECSGSNKEVFD